MREGIEMRRLTGTPHRRFRPGSGRGPRPVAGILALALSALVALTLLGQHPGVAASSSAPGQAASGASEDVSAVAETEAAEAADAQAAEEPIAGPIDLSGSWKFRADPSELGLSEGWHEPGYSDLDWGALGVPGSWESQGVTEANPQWPGATAECGYNGYAWYRTRFSVPTGWEQAELALRVGQIWDMDWTYLNGHRIGLTTGEGAWQRRREYALPTDALRPGEDNVLAIRVFDGVGEGGIGVAPVEIVNLAAAAGRAAADEEPREYARTRNELVRIGGSATVGPEEKVDGDVVAIGGGVTIEGYVTGDVVAVGGGIRALDGARIDGDTVAVGGGVQRDEGAVIGGEVVEIGPGVVLPGDWPIVMGPRPWAVGGVAGAVVGFLIWGFLALAAVLLLRRRIEAMAEALPLHPGRSIVYGLSGFVLAPAALATLGIVAAVVTVLLVVTVVGALLVPAVAAAFLAALAASAIAVLLGIVAVWLSIGKAVAAQFGKPDLHPALGVLIGAVIVAIASQIPHIGPLVHVTVVVFGLGLAIMTGIGADAEWAHRRLGFGRRAAAPSSPEPPSPPPPSAAGGEATGSVTSQPPSVGTPPGEHAQSQGSPDAAGDREEGGTRGPTDSNQAGGQ
jgi:hypothetical protein